MLLEALGRHERVGDARRAGRDGENLDVVGRRGSLCSGRLRDELAVFLLVDDVEELVFRLRGNQRLFEVVVHNHRGELLKDGQVLVIRAVRCGDHEEEAGRLAVEGLVVHALRHRHGGEAGFGDASRFCMRRGEAVPEARRALGFTREHVFLVLRLVREVAAFFHEANEQVDGRCLVSRRCPELNALRLEEIGDSHCVCTLLFIDKERDECKFGSLPL